MKTCSVDLYHHLIAGATVLSRDTHGDKVLETTGGLIVKVFRIKRIFSSARLIPYARRFNRAARELKARGIPSVEMKDIFHIKGTNKDAVVYKPLPGETLRDTLAASATPDKIMNRFVSFFALLHTKGIYFRAIHLANVVVLPNGQMGLIDISEARFFSRALKIKMRARNFNPLLRYQEDQNSIERYGIKRFLTQYIEQSHITEKHTKQLGSMLAMINSIFTDAGVII